jgi:hypothetical protein
LRQSLTPSSQLNRRTRRIVQIPDSSSRNLLRSSSARHQLIPYRHRRTSAFSRPPLSTTTSLDHRLSRPPPASFLQIPTHNVHPLLSHSHEYCTTFKMLAEDQSRLQKIDELYDLRLDQYISLPQVSLLGAYFRRMLMKNMIACCRG